MKLTGAKRGSNILFCIILIALLGVLGGGYALMLSFNTNSSVSQREFQQEYLAADSLRQSLVDSIQVGDNPLLADMSDKIKQEITDYLAYRDEYDQANENQKKALADAHGLPELHLMRINDMMLKYSGEQTLTNGAAVKVDTAYTVGEKMMTITVDYKGAENYKLSVTLKSNGTPVEGGQGVHKGKTEIGLFDYTNNDGYAAADKDTLKTNLKDGVTCDATAGDCYYTIGSGNKGTITIDVSKINIIGGNRAFLIIPSGHNVTLHGKMTKDYTGQLIILQTEGKKGDTSLALSDGLNFYGQIYMPNTVLSVSGPAELTGTITMGSVGTSVRNLVVHEQFQGFSGTEIGSLDDLGDYFKNGGGVSPQADEGRDTSYDYLFDLTGWEVVRYYEG